MRFASRKPDYLPKAFYNIKADLPSPPRPPLHPGTKEPLKPEDLEAIFPKGFIRQEGLTARDIPIPSPVLEAYSVFRPTPLVEATALKKHLGTPARIFYKYEGVGPVGSHKTNTAFMQAYLAAEDGVKTLATETGAGQWGSALAYAGSRFGIETRVFIVRSSYRHKPGRRVLMEMFGGTVVESPSPTTDAGRKFFEKDPEHPGSLGIAISEAVELTVKNPGIKYALGSVLDSVLMHQTVIGLEAEKQMEEFGAVPDTIIGCVGGLRYHGMAPLVSHLTDMGVVEPRGIDQKSVFNAAVLFMKTEGILPAPESSHAIAVAIVEALKAKEAGRETVILFNLSGHGFLDISAYDGKGNGR